MNLLVIKSDTLNLFTKTWLACKSIRCYVKSVSFSDIRFWLTWLGTVSWFCPCLFCNAASQEISGKFSLEFLF